MNLHAEFTLRRGTLELDVDLRASAGQTLALVGPNGAGKSTCLHVLAGLLRIERGRVQCGDDLLDGGPGGVFVPPEHRAAGVVFQDHLLFPHLTALDNVAFALRARGSDRRPARAAADDWLQRVGLRSHAHTLPRALSGGQAQRVALARALAGAPRMLLLDEPLSAVDASARLLLRRGLRAHLDAFAGVRLVVAHDALDAFALADRIAVLEAGRIVQTGTVAEICGRPRRHQPAARHGGARCAAAARRWLAGGAGRPSRTRDRHRAPARDRVVPRTAGRFAAQRLVGRHRGGRSRRRPHARTARRGGAAGCRGDAGCGGRTRAGAGRRCLGRAEGDRDHDRPRLIRRAPQCADSSGTQLVNNVSTLFCPSSCVVTRRNGARRPPVVR
jgi:ABC-type nitrate/sulfonate/bicarbonate transport system ATPase subunit